ncbi:MAG: hypothetical protein J6Y31_04765 [Bacteroidales bacterium]|nr:hypothetical protein [Bacteroidales bacterium]
MKKTMKLFGILAITAIAFSCSKEADVAVNAQTQAESGDTEQNQDPVTPAVDGKVLTSFGVELEPTRVTVGIEDGATSIEGGDEVLVFVDGSNYATYVYDTDAAAFVIKENETPVTLDSPASVFYPANLFSYKNASVCFTMPNPCGIEADGDLGAINPMAGKITEESGSYTVTLTSIASILRVKVTADVNINGVKLDYGTGYDYAALADFRVDASSFTMEFAASGNKTYETVNLDTPSTSADVLFLIPTVELPAGLSVTANLAANHNGGIDSFTVTNSSTAARKSNVISSMSFYAGLFSGGAGTAADPYKIATARDFKDISKYCSNGYRDADGFRAADFLAANYLQLADIEFAKTGTATIATIGTYNTAAFSGTYNGDGKTLSRFEIAKTNDSSTGLFEYLSEATIKNVKIANSVVNGGDASGILGGRVIGATTVDNCDVSNSTVYGSNAVGGVVAHISGSTTVQNCDVENIEIITTDQMTSTPNNQGGVIGYSATSGAIKSCTASGTVTFTNDDLRPNGQNRGGIIGRQNNTGVIQSCTNNATVTSNAFCVGGVIGLIDKASNISITKNNGNVSGKYNVGGIIGQKTNGNIYSAVVNTGEISGEYNVGGLVGYQTGGPIHSNMGATFGNTNNQVKNEGTVKATGKNGNGYTCAGGLIGRMDAGTLGQNNAYNQAVNTGDVTANGGGGAVGGLVGYLMGGTIKHCLSNATVVNNGGSTGGAVGYMYKGTVANSTAKGKVKGASNVGGFIGEFQANDDSYVVNCLASATTITTANAANVGVGGFVGYVRNAVADKIATIANCVVWDNLIKAPNEKNEASNKVRAGGFAGVQNSVTNKPNSVIRNCYFQGEPGHVGYGGGEDDDTFTHFAGTSGTVIATFVGYANGTLSDVYGLGTVRSGGSPVVSNVTSVGANFIHGTAKNENDITLSNSKGTVAAGTKTFGEVLSQAADGDTIGGIALSSWTSYTADGWTYYYPSILGQLGSDAFYKK